MPVLDAMFALGHSILAAEFSGECGGIVKNCYEYLFTTGDTEVHRGSNVRPMTKTASQGRTRRPPLHGFHCCWGCCGGVSVADLPADLCAEPHMARWACA